MRIDCRCTARPPTTGVVFCGKYDTLLQGGNLGPGRVPSNSNTPFTCVRTAFG